MDGYTRRFPEAGLTSPPCVLGSPQFIMLRGELGSVCHRRAKTMLMILIKAFRCSWGGAGEETGLLFLSLMLYLRGGLRSQGWVGPALEGLPASMPMFGLSLHFCQGLHPSDEGQLGTMGGSLERGRGRRVPSDGGRESAFPLGPQWELCLKRLQVV